MYFIILPVLLNYFLKERADNAKKVVPLWQKRSMENCIIRCWNGEVLNIISTPEEGGLFCDGKFKNDRDIAAFIEDDIEIAILCAVNKNNNNDYLLNICSRTPHAALTLEGEIQLSRQQAEIYMPIIKYFLQYGFNNLFASWNKEMDSLREKGQVNQIERRNA